jgi:tetratricopeptide (TPR) repeat protein
MRARMMTLVVLLSTGWRPGFAAPRREVDDLTQMARVHFTVGRGHVQRHEYAAAMHEFELGYQLKPLPLFLYNIGRVAQVAGLYERSLEAFQQYLNRFPRAPECREVRWWVATLRQRVAEERVTAPEPPPAPEPEAPAPPPAAAPAPAPAGTVVVLHPFSDPDSGNNTSLTANPNPKPRRRGLWIALGTVGGVLVAGGAVALGVIYGTGGSKSQLPDGYHDLGNFGVQGLR